MEAKKNGKLGVIIIILISVVLIAATVTVILLTMPHDTILSRIISVSELVGDVTVENNGEVYKAYPDMHLTDGFAMTTAKDSYSRLSLDESKFVKLEELSRAVFKAMGGGGKSTAIVLDYGELSNEIMRPLEAGEEYTVTTPNAVLTVRGTIFITRVRQGTDGKTYTDVYTFSGSVASHRVLTDGTEVSETVMINKGNKTTIVTEADGGDTISTTYYIEEVDDGKEPDYVDPIEIDDIDSDILVELFAYAKAGRDLCFTQEEIKEVLDERGVDLSKCISPLDGQPLVDEPPVPPLITDPTFTSADTSIPKEPDDPEGPGEGSVPEETTVSDSETTTSTNGSVPDDDTTVPPQTTTSSGDTTVPPDVTTTADTTTTPKTTTSEDVTTTPKTTTVPEPPPSPTTVTPADTTTPPPLITPPSAYLRDPQVTTTPNVTTTPPTTVPPDAQTPPTTVPTSGPDTTSGPTDTTTSEATTTSDVTTTGETSCEHIYGLIGVYMVEGTEDDPQFEGILKCSNCLDKQIVAGTITGSGVLADGSTKYYIDFTYDGETYSDTYTTDPPHVHEYELGDISMEGTLEAPTFFAALTCKHCSDRVELESIDYTGPVTLLNEDEVFTVNFTYNGVSYSKDYTYSLHEKGCTFDGTGTWRKVFDPEEPGCTEDQTVYVYCPVCNKLMSSYVITASGHDYAVTNVTRVRYSGDDAEITGELRCKNCSDSHDLGYAAIDRWCILPNGDFIYYITFTYDGQTYSATYSDSMTDECEEHDYSYTSDDQPYPMWNSNKTACTARFYCKNLCGDYVDVECTIVDDVLIDGMEWRVATCSFADGVYTLQGAPMYTLTGEE